MKIGTIGTGVIVEEFIKAARSVEGVQFEAVYSRTMEGAKEFAEKVGVEKTYDVLDEMLADPKIDVIYVASPNSLHYEQSTAALYAGKHVIVEKPFTGNRDRAETLIDLAKSQKLMLFEAICNIHMPHFNYIKDQLNTIGNLKIVQANYSQYSSRYDLLLEGETPNVFNPEFSGGALADINIYNLHFVVGMFGMPNTIDYRANQHENGIDTSGVLVLGYDGFVAECVGAKDSFSKNFGQLQGDKGYIYVDSSLSQLNSVKTVTKDGEMDYNIQDKHRLAYQVEAFKDMVDRNDFEMRDRYLQHSYNVVDVAHQARLGINLKFYK